MQGLKLVKDLAEVETELAKKLGETHRVAEQRIAKAEEEARRILQEANAQINQLVDNLKVRIALETERLAEEGRSRAEAEAEQIRQQASGNMNRCVDFVLSEVLP